MDKKISETMKSLDPKGKWFRLLTMACLFQIIKTKSDGILRKLSSLHLSQKKKKPRLNHH